MSESDTRYEERLNSIAKAVSDVARNQQQFTQRQRQQEESDLEARIEARAHELESQFKRAENMVSQAEKAVASAYESGDGSEIARANRAMTEAVAARESARAEVANHKTARQEYNERRERERKKAEEASKPKDAPDFTNLNNWKSRNSEWYGVDTDLTKAAHEIDQTIRAAGVIPVGSKEYFEAIDKQMARKFPDRFNRSPDTASGGSTAPSTNAAQAGRIPASVVDSWRRMGIAVDDPKVMERMVKHRQTAVQKGFLPETPVYEAIRT